MKRVLQMGGSAARLHSKVSILNATRTQAGSLIPLDHPALLQWELSVEAQTPPTAVSP